MELIMKHFFLIILTLALILNGCEDSSTSVTEETSINLDELYVNDTLMEVDREYPIGTVIVDETNEMEFVVLPYKCMPINSPDWNPNGEVHVTSGHIPSGSGLELRLTNACIGVLSDDLSKAEVLFAEYGGTVNLWLNDTIWVGEDYEESVLTNFFGMPIRLLDLVFPGGFYEATLQIDGLLHACDFFSGAVPDDVYDPTVDQSYLHWKYSLVIGGQELFIDDIVLYP